MQLKSMRNLQIIIDTIGRKENFFAFIFLIALAFGIHHSALNGFWRFDDGDHLKFVAIYSPWQYFFQPSIVVQQSAHITPYNALFYEINLALFGMNPKGYYAHQILILGGTAFATYRLMRLWQNPMTALLAAILFLLGLPTFHIAQQLMTGHYSTGLLFSVISLYFFTIGVKQEKYKWVLLGSVFYLLETLCKEVYVPLVLLLPFLPVATLKMRLKASLPFVMVAVFYTIWRYIVLGQLVGGYTATSINILDRFYQLLSIPLLLLGWYPGLDRIEYLMRDGFIYLLTLSSFLILMVVANYHKRLNFVLIWVSFLLIFVPLWPLTTFPGVNSPDRYLFLLWWGCSILISIVFRELGVISKNYPIKYICAIGLFLLLITVQNREYRRYYPMISKFEELYRTALEMDSHTALIPPSSPGGYYHTILSGILRAKNILETGVDVSTNIITNKDFLCQNAQKKFKILEFDENCGCVKDVTDRLDDALKSKSQFYWKGISSAENISCDTKYCEVRSIPNIPLQINMTFKNNVLHWELAPFKDGVYFILSKESRVIVPIRGEHRFTLVEPIRFQFGHQSSDGTLAVSPPLVFDTKKQSEFNWSGVGVVENVSCEVK